MIRPASLTARLLVGLLVITGLALALSLLGATLVIRDYLHDRVRDQLRAVAGAPLAAAEGPRPDLCAAQFTDNILPSDFRVSVVDASGAVRCRVPEASEQAPVPAPDQLARLADDGTVYSVGTGSGSSLATVVRSDRPDGAEYLVVALSLRDVDQTVRRLVLGGVLVGLSVLAGLALVGLGVIRLGLRPLTEIREATRAIARGDLAARVPDGSPGTEVGELSTALNTMLTEIERGFEQRRASERRIRQFAADASHELRTPLTSIKGYAQLYEQLGPGVPDRPGIEASSTERDRVVRRIGSEADRMATLVEDLLLLARLDQDPDRALAREPVDVLEVAHDVVAAARAVHPHRVVELRVGSPAEATDELGPPVLVRGDPHRLQQVLGNLVTNALVHTPGSVRVDLSRTATEVTVRVADDGPGMPAEVRGQVFERFFRADQGRSRDRGGAGLGLSIVAALVAAHGGSVTCDSSAAGGTTFLVRLPPA